MNSAESVSVDSIVALAFPEDVHIFADNVPDDSANYVADTLHVEDCDE